MDRHATDAQEPLQESAPYPPLPADHVLSSGAVLFPGAFDQHGCPLIVFPVDGQVRLSSQLSKAEVVDFINYFLCLHNKKQEKQSLVSLVADLRQASPPTTRFIAETLRLLELHKRTVHSVYIIQPKKKDVGKLLLKLLAPSKTYAAPFKKVLLKEISELSNYIDRSQLPASLGGYLMYCHHSWAVFIKEIDTFVQDFLSVVQRLPSYISTLQALSRLPLPSTFTELQHFCSTNEATFQQLRRELGLDELLRHCDSVVEKLRYPDREPCYQAMAGTALFTHTAFDMLQNHSRITAAVEKVDLLWQQAFSKAHLQLRVFQLRDDALQITEKIETLLREKLQPYKIEIAKDAMTAVTRASEFEASIYTPAMTLVCCAEDVIHTLTEILPVDGQTRESWVLDLERLKEKLHSAVHFILQTLKAVCNYHRYYNKANSWYSLILCENFLQQLLSGVQDAAATQQPRKNWATIPAWKLKLSAFLKKNPPPDMEELLHLAHLSNAIPDDEVQLAGKQMSQRCMTLRKLLISSGPVAVGHLQLALQWQYELLRSSHMNQSPADSALHRTAQDAQLSSSESNLPLCERGKDAAQVLGTPLSTVVSGMVSAEDKPHSHSSFDSGFDGAGSSQLEVWGGREGGEGLSRLGGTKDSLRPARIHPQIQEEKISSVSDSEDHGEEFDLGSVGNSSRASVQIIPKVTVDSLNFEIKVKRSAALPSNPWLGLPVDDLENSYTVTITQNPTPQKREPQFHDSSEPHATANQSNGSRDQPTQTEVLSSTEPRGLQTRDWTPHPLSTLEDSELSPISNILSSTITDGRDKSMCTTEGIPTLLWDSYDLHDQNLDATDGGVDISLTDWDVKEQESLREVEKILDRTDEILEEEENVLAQEAMLDALVRSEHRRDLWPPWDSEDQLGVMSPSELTEGGVLGLEDSLDPTESDSLSEPGSLESDSETKASAEGEHHTETVMEAGRGLFNSRPDLLRELKKVHILDELIMEENLKINELRRCEENLNSELSEGEPVDRNGSFSVSKEREYFWFQLEKEKREVEKLERSWDKEHRVEKCLDKATEVERCSIVEKCRSEEEEEEDDAEAPCGVCLSDSCNCAHSRPSSLVVQDDSQDEDAYKPETTQAASHLVVSKTTTQDLDELSIYQDSGADLCVCNTNSNMDVQPQGSIYGEQLDSSGENGSTCNPEASLTPEMSPEDGAFDPGGSSVLPPPVPKPRKASLPVIDGLAQLETLHSSPPYLVAHDPVLVQPDPQDQEFDAVPENVTGDTIHSSVLSPDVKEYCNNNNNNNQVLPGNCDVSSESEIPTDHEEGPSVVPAGLLQKKAEISSPPADNGSYQLSVPQLPPDQPLEFDPGGRDELNQDWCNGAHSSEAVRVSHSGSPGIQTQLSCNISEISDFKTPIVLDTGSGLMKAGFADQDLPNVIFPTIIGMPKYEEIMNGNFERETYIGHDAQHMRGVLALKHPIKNGIIRSWDDMEKIWHHTFEQLGVDPEDHPVLLTEAAMNPRENRQRMVQIMFESFNVPFAYVAMQAVLALYAAGRSTGVVLDSGDGVSHSVPVFEGYSLPHAVQRFPLAGGDVTMHLKKLLQEQGVCLRTSAEEEIVREMKEKCCCVALDYEAELRRGGSSCTEMCYTMPDGQVVTLHTERFRAPEILFKPELIGRDHYGMHESVFKSILSSDIDLRRCFLENIVLSGGNTLLPGLPERLQAEIRGLLPTDMAESVRVSSPKDRDFSVWSGGAVLANLPSFSSACISQEEYEEHGPQIVFNKCF